MRPLIPIASLAVIGAGLTLALVGRGAQNEIFATEAEAQPIVIRCMKVKPQPHVLTEVFYGFIEPIASVEVAFEVSGRIDRLGESWSSARLQGTRVVAGDVLAAIEPSRYVAAFNRATAQVDLAQAEVAAAESRVANARAVRDDAAADLNRMRQVFQNSAASINEVHKSELALEIAQMQHDHAISQRDSAIAALDIAVAELAQSEANRRATNLAAPLTGLVSAVHVEVGETISPADAVATLVDISTVKLIIGVVEQKLLLLEEGQPVNVEVNALSARSKLLNARSDDTPIFTGHVTTIAPAADPVTGLFEVEIELPNEGERLRPGMIGKAVVSIAETKALAVPRDAVVEAGHTAWLFCVDGLDFSSTAASMPMPLVRVHRVLIDPDSLRGSEYIIEEFPVDLEYLVIDDPAQLVDGQHVRVLIDEPGLSPGREIVIETRDSLR